MVKKKQKGKETVFFKVEKYFLRISFPIFIILVSLGYFAFRLGNQYISNLLVEWSGYFFIFALITSIIWITHIIKKVRRGL